MSRFVAWISAILFVAGVACSPIDVPTPSSELLPPFEESPQTFNADSYSQKFDDVKPPATELLPPSEDENLPTLATDLVAPPIDGPKDEWSSNDKESIRERNVSATLFVINVYSVKNQSAEDSNDVLHDDVFQEVPDGVVEPLAMFLLVIEDKDEDHPVSLDEVAKDLEAEGFVVEKIERDGETRLVKVDIESSETMMRANPEEQELSNAIERVGMDLVSDMTKNEEAAKEEESSTPTIDTSSKLKKIRRKRHLCLKCGGGGGGYYPQPVQVIPVPIYGGQGHHHKSHHHGGGGGYYPQPQPQPYYPQQQPCNTCGGQYPYYGNQGGNSHAQASAQASASASAQSW